MHLVRSNILQLQSTMNINEILNYNRPKNTYYDILGCAKSSSIDQINREYKLKALKLHPDKNPDPNSAQEFRLVQRAKDVLTDSITRKSYDSWLDSRINIPFEQWQAKRGHSMHWAPPKSSKLPIKSDSSKGQGSDYSSSSSNVQRTKDTNLLEKFRNYEI